MYKVRVYEGKVICDMWDVLDVLRDTLGDEFADITEQVVSDMVSTADAATIDSMSNQLDAVNESWANVVRDARDSINIALSKKRLDRQDIIHIRNYLDAEL